MRRVRSHVTHRVDCALSAVVYQLDQVSFESGAKYAPMPHRLGPIRTAPECRAHLAASWSEAETAVYVLWDRATQTAIYCGTSRTPGRLRSHLAKDDLANGPVGKTHVNPELRSFCLSQGKGWLGVSFTVFSDEAAARQVEREIISSLGIRRYGGQLYNQRLSG